MGGHLCRHTFSSRHLADSPASGVRLCAQRRVSLRWPLTLVRIPEKHKGGFGEPERVRDHRNSDV